MDSKLLAFGCVTALGLVACNPPAPVTDTGVPQDTSGTDVGEPEDTGGTDGGSGGCGADGLACLTVDDGMPADMACLGTVTAPTDTTEREITFRLVARGLSETVMSGDFEIYPDNIVAESCTGDCIELTAGADGMVMGTVPGTWYAYRAPANPGPTPGMHATFETVGFNRPPAAAGGTDTITAIEVGIFSAALGAIRTGLVRDMDDGVITGDIADCDGAGLNGVTTRLFLNDGTEVLPGTEAEDMGLGYRRNGALPAPSLRTTDDSGGYAYANVPIPADGTINLVSYGTLEEGGERVVIGCENVAVGANVLTVLSAGPLRSDYPTGSYCATLMAE